MRYAVVFGVIGSMMLSACSDTPPKLRDLYDPYAGPEEFAVSPNLELEMPQDLASLPTPTPGGKNLTDPNPKGDAIALLGGDPNRVTASQSGTNDGALWTYATRFGFDPNISRNSFRRRPQVPIDSGAVFANQTVPRGPL